MSEFPETDLDTLRRSRIARLEAELHELASRLTHLHWPSAEAEVTECRQANNLYGPGTGISPFDLGYIVSFTYTVDGKIYDGALNSPVEVLRGDRFQLRYNPERPNENNSLCSENSPSQYLTWTVTFLIALLLLILFLKERFFRN